MNLEYMEVRNMENILTLNWEILNIEVQKEERYCHNCGKKVIFEDSLKRRQNANGKNIHYFAIYKCVNGHTWNKRISMFKAIPKLENNPEYIENRLSFQEILIINQLITEGFEKIQISLNMLTDNVRIDKFLGERICDKSRGEIIHWIESRRILVNNTTVKPKTKIREKDTITILL